MGWSIRFDPRAARDLEHLDRQAQIRILRFLRERVAASEDPRSLGQPLSGPLRKFWEYRVGSYRLVADILDGELVVLVIRVGHRSSVYDR